MSLRSIFSRQNIRFILIHVLLMCGVLLLLILVGVKGLDVYTQHGKTVTVPEVIGTDLQTAAKLFRNHHLSYVVIDSSYTKNYPAGAVIDCTPPVGQDVKEGRKIYLTINTRNVPLRRVPDVADNSSLRQAEAKLMASGFKLAETEFIAGEKDWVYGVKYNNRPLAAGEQVPMGATLSLVVGDGGRDEEPAAPDTLGVEKLQIINAANQTDDSWF